MDAAARADVARLREAAAECSGQPDCAEAILTLMFGSDGDEVRSSHGSMLGAYALWLEAARRPALRELATGWTAAYIEVISELLHRAGVADPRALARVILATIDGLILQQLVEARSVIRRPVLHGLITRMVAPR